MKATSLATFCCFLILGLSQLRAYPTAPLAQAHPEQYRPPSPPVGNLGLPLGTFAVIEGIYHPYGIGPKSPGFSLETVNGKKVDRAVHFSVMGNLVDGKRYVLHGYETGYWEPGDTNTAPDEEYLGSPRISFIFGPNFEMTSIEKIDGTTVADAKPIDPKIPLIEPKWDAKPDSPPIGILGLPLGTFTVIEAHSSPKPTMLGSPFAVTKVNGKKIDPPLIISIPDAPKTQSDEHLTLHGYETGNWSGLPILPKTEILSATQPQHPFQFSERFNIMRQDRELLLKSHDKSGNP